MTKLQLLNLITEADIFKKYVPGFNPTAKKNYKSPFGDKDNKPSLTIYPDGNSLKFKSHNTGHQGDVFQFVADLNKIDCKKNFSQVVEIIAKDFSLNGYAKKAAVKPVPVVPDKKRNVKISFEKAPSVQMLQYFEQFKIDLETLIRFKVSQVKYHEFISSSGKLCKFDYRKTNQLAVCYSVDDKIKIYFPAIAGIQEKSFGFKDQTTKNIFGLQQISNEHHKNLLVAAGEKDCLALNANGFPAVAFQSENTIPSKEQIDIINSIADRIFVVYDNDQPGRGAAKKLIEKTSWHIINLPDEFKDAAEFFKVKTASDFSNLIPPAGPVDTDKDDEDEKEIWTVFHQAEKYLSRVYDLRFNTIKLEMELKRKAEKEYRPLNENSLFVEMNKAGIKIGMDKLIAILKSDFVEKYDPFISYFSGLPTWDGGDYIGELATFIDCNDQLNFAIQFTKWMMRCVKCATIPGYYNKQAFILIHNKQNSGKTTFCRFLCPPALKEYLAENISDDKDSKIAIAKNFLINLDELSSLAKHEINSLKALFSKDIINERLPYDRKATIIHRVASFIGSTNMAEFLTDETGSVRWLCFEIKAIDWSYKKHVDINKCWAQAIGMIKEGIPAEMDHKEIEENESRNSKFQQRSTEAELIPNFLLPAKEIDQDAVFMTASDVLIYLSLFTTIKLNRIAIGRAMPACGFHRVKESVSDRYGYFVKKLK
jgi:hypothetical protein